MHAILFTLLTGAFAATGPVMHPDLARERWRYTNHICWQGETPDRRAVSDTEVKVACISAGVLIERLLAAGYCLHPERDEWERCG